MDAAALALNIDSSSVFVAAENLDRFSASAAKAGAASGSQSGSIAKLVATVHSMNTKLGAIVSGLDKVNSALAGMAKASQGAAAANDNVARAIGMADAHVVAYTQHLTAMAASQTGVSAAVAAADAHVIAYTQHLAGLSRTQQDANAHVLAYQASLKAVPAVIGQADSHVLAYRNSLKEVEDSAKKVSTAIKFTATDSLNASRQLADIGVTAAMGMSPFMIAIQQGPQLLDILQNKAAMTGQTLGTVFRAAAVQIGAALVPFLPLIAAVAALAAAFAALTAQANKDSGLKKYTTEMGYTKAEVKKLNAVTVEFGDTMKAVWQVSLESAASALGINTKTMGKTWEAFLSRIVSSARAALAGIYALFAGTKAYLGEIEKGGLIGLGKMAIGQGDPKLLEKTYGKAYQDSQKFMDRIVSQARTNARKRQDEMAKGFYDAPKAKKGPKEYGFGDLLKDADKTRNDLTKQAAQIGLYGEALARVTYEQDLLNKASEHGLKLSPQQKTAIAGIAAELAKLAEANRLATYREEFKQGNAEWSQQMADRTAQIGLQGEALNALRIEQELLTKARSQHLTLSDGDREAIRLEAARRAAEDYQATRAESEVTASRAHNDRMRQLSAERDGIALTGKALLSYQYQQEMINKAVQDGIAFADIDYASIKRKGDAYALIRYEVDKAIAAFNSAKEASSRFFDQLASSRDMGKNWGASLVDSFAKINGYTETFVTSMRRSLDEGQSKWTSFGNGVSAVVDRIIVKLMDRTFQRLIDQLFQAVPATGGGFLGSVGRFLTNKPTAVPDTPKVGEWSRLGNTYGSPQRFANGGSFTNKIVNTPTLFRFANGAKMGEMGEAGPEAIMPLKRGPNGSLGVQMHGGGRPTIKMGDVHMHNSFAGAIGIDSVAEMNRQAAEAAVATVKRQFAEIAAEYEQNGVVMP